MAEENKEKKEKIKFEMDKTSFYKYLSVILGVLFVISLFTSGFGIKLNKGTSNDDIIIKQPSNGQPSTESIIEVSLDDDSVLGNENAPIVLIEFSDYQCPFCGRWFDQTLPSVEEQYIKTGKVKLVYRDFPLDFHQQAQSAAEASECADEQGKFREMHDEIFENQDDWSVRGIEAFKEYSSTIGLNTQDFNSCLDSGKYTEEVKNDLNDGQSYAVSGTPTFFIARSNGNTIKAPVCSPGESICGNAETGFRIVGAHPFSTFQEALDSF